MGHAVPKLPELRSPLSARRALKVAGYADLAELFDDLRPRIAPASMLIGDLALMAGDGDLDALVISAGGKVLGYHADALERGLVPIEPFGPEPFVAAWRL